MTACIAAVCEQGKAIVMVADRMVTFSLLGVTIESENKIHLLNKNHAVMIAGDGRRGRSLIKSLPSNESMSSVIETSVKNYRNAREKLFDDKNLIPIGYDRERFELYGKAQLPREVFDVIYMQMKNFDFELDILHAGFDGGVAKIVRVENPGVDRSSDGLAYDVIGAQGLIMLHMELNGYTVDCDLAKALFLAYCAKRQTAELNKGVGLQTDIKILTNDGERPIDTDLLLKALNSEYERIYKRPQPNLDSITELLR